jgi:PAS domain S-box-containing protein
MIYEYAGSGIATVDLSGAVEQCNPALCALVGYSETELRSLNFATLIHPEDRVRYLVELRRLQKGELPLFTIDSRLLHKDGRAVPVIQIISMIPDEKGEAAHVIALVSDLSRRPSDPVLRDDAEQLRLFEAVEETLRIERDKLKLAESLLRDSAALHGAIVDTAVDSIVVIDDSGIIQSANPATQAIFGYSTDELINTRVEHMVKLLEHALGEDVELDAQRARDLWEANCDSGEFDSTLVNLAINARDAMPDGGGLVITTHNVTLEAHASRLHPDARQGDYVRVSVIDTGTGMTPDVRKRAMDPFFTTKDPGKGTGLGLSSVYSFVKQSGGFVTLASERGKGTTVSLYVPRVLDDAVAKHGAGAKDMPRGDGELILVVEDDDRVREITLKRLESLGYAVAEARSGPEAIQLLKSGEPIDLVFSDIAMPGKMIGYDVAQWVTTMKPNVKVVLTTGYNEIGSEGDALPAGDNIPVLDKPYTRERLAQTMRSVLVNQFA